MATPVRSYAMSHPHVAGGQPCALVSAEARGGNPGRVERAGTGSVGGRSLVGVAVRLRARVGRVWP
jgi:hypothetical protein